MTSTPNWSLPPAPPKTTQRRAGLNQGAWSDSRRWCISADRLSNAHRMRGTTMVACLRRTRARAKLGMESQNGNAGARHSNLAIRSEHCVPTSAPSRMRVQRVRSSGTTLAHGHGHDSLDLAAARFVINHNGACAGVQIRSSESNDMRTCLRTTVPHIWFEFDVHTLAPGPQTHDPSPLLIDHSLYDNMILRAWCLCQAAEGERVQWKPPNRWRRRCMHALRSTTVMQFSAPMLIHTVSLPS